MQKKFNAFDLDQLIDDCTGQVDNISEELSTYDNTQVSQGDPQINNLMNTTGAEVDFVRVYQQLQKLIQNGNNALQVLAAIQPQQIQPGTMAATATLMNAIKNCISEFTKIHAIHIKHQMALDLQNQRHKNKKQLFEMKLNSKQNSTQNIQTQTPLHQFSDKTTRDIFIYLQQEKQKREKN